jgi:ribose 5-phosphate isomerase B
MNWVLASDHAGVQLKKALLGYLEEQGHFAYDLGVEERESVDYPEPADKAVEALLKGGANLGILVCGTGLGVSMRANRYKGIRATLITNNFSAQAAKEHSNANILCFGERITTEKEALEYLETFLKATFEGGRHQRRIDKLDAPLITEDHKENKEA